MPNLESDAPPQKKVSAHRIVVEGEYLAKPLPHDAGGEFGPRKISYREEFVISVDDKKIGRDANGHPLLGHLLSDALLKKRLSDKDPDFRGIRTHAIVKREEVFE